MDTPINTIIRSALRAVDPYRAAQNHLKLQNENLICGDKIYSLNKFERVRVIGFGKGSAPMAHAVHNLLAHRLSDGWVIVKYGHTLSPEIDISPIKIVGAGHPIPDENSLKHSRALVDFLADSTDKDLVICLISGGGSALLSLPLPGVSLAAIQSLTEQLLKAGAPITEINTIRKHLSQVKGGKLAKLISPATTISLILSDVGGDPLDAIASGPTAPDSDTFSEALAILDRYALTETTSPEIIHALKAGKAHKIPETPKHGDSIFERVQNHIIGNNEMACVAAQNAARDLGYQVTFLPDFIEGEAREIAKNLIAPRVKQLRAEVDASGKPAAFIFGGESTVTVNGDGLGGRNQEMALASALEIQGIKNVQVACVATDGNDGPTDAAGAIITGSTVAKGKKQSFNAQTMLDENDSYHFLKVTGDLLITGATNTNVNDVVIILAEKVADDASVIYNEVAF